MDTSNMNTRVRHIDFEYPRAVGNPNKIEIHLSDIRAADSIRISYDFDRDGWAIEQASIFEWACNDTICDEDWQEVAFVKAWQREVNRTDK